MIQVEEFKGEREQWDAYVQRSADTTFSHLIGWREVLKHCIKARPYYFFAHEAGEMRGILPLFLVRSLFLGRILVSLPFLDYGGIVGDSPEVVSLLLKKAEELGRRLRCSYVEFRQLKPLPDLGESNTDKVAVCAELDADPMVVHRRFNKSVRRNLKKAKKHPLEVRIAPDQLESFYRIYSIVMRDKTSPVEPYSFFSSIVNTFKDRIRFTVVRLEGKTVAAQLLFFFKDISFIQWGCALKEYFDYRIDYAQIWEAFKYSCERGFHSLDLGRSTRDSGAHRFKRQWRGEDRTVYNQKIVRNEAALATHDDMMAESSLKRQLWRRLPVKVANLIGPFLRRQVP